MFLLCAVFPGVPGETDAFKATRSKIQLTQTTYPLHMLTELTCHCHLPLYASDYSRVTLM